MVEFDGLIPDSKKSCTHKETINPVKYLNYNGHQENLVRSFFEKNNSALPLNVSVEPRTLEDTIAAATTVTPMMTLVGADATEDRAEEFFNGFVPPMLFSIGEIEAVKLALARAGATTDKLEAGQHIEAAHRALLKSGFIIPLGQLMSKQLYPPRIKNIHLADRIHGFPDIHVMEME